MPMKQQQRQVYRTMQGKEVDMFKLIARNELTPAVGNVKVNARGDKLGPGGKIIKSAEFETLTVPTGQGTVGQRVITKDISGMNPEGNE
jgi:hypothetical protein